MLPKDILLNCLLKHESYSRKILFEAMYLERYLVRGEISKKRSCARVIGISLKIYRSRAHFRICIILWSLSRDITCSRWYEKMIYSRESRRSLLQTLYTKNLVRNDISQEKSRPRWYSPSIKWEYFLHIDDNITFSCKAIEIELASLLFLQLSQTVWCIRHAEVKEIVSFGNL